MGFSMILIFFRSGLISSSHVRCGLPLGRLAFLRYSTSASLAGVSAWMKSHQVAEPIEVSSYGVAPLVSFDVHFDVGDILRPLFC